jgi:hypothetical protein
MEGVGLFGERFDLGHVLIQIFGERSVLDGMVTGSCVQDACVAAHRRAPRLKC